MTKGRILRVRILIYELLVLASFLGVVSCGPKTKKTEVTQGCVVNEDQRLTFLGRWSSTPIPVALQIGDWSTAERNQIQRGIDSWNSHFLSAKGKPVFQLIAEPRSQPAIRSCSDYANANPGGSGFSTPIIIRKVKCTTGTTCTASNSPWRSELNAVIALTTTCRGGTSSDGLPQFKAASMELNFVYFFTDTSLNNPKRFPDLATIITHELGHLLGLAHSATTQSNSSGVPRTTDGVNPREYTQAVMYEDHKFDGNGQGIPRDQLNENDKGRASCLY